MPYTAPYPHTPTTTSNSSAVYKNQRRKISVLIRQRMEGENVIHHIVIALSPRLPSQYNWLPDIRHQHSLSAVPPKLIRFVSVQMRRGIKAHFFHDVVVAPGSGHGFWLENATSAADRQSHEKLMLFSRAIPSSPSPPIRSAQEEDSEDPRNIAREKARFRFRSRYFGEDSGEDPIIDIGGIDTVPGLEHENESSPGDEETWYGLPFRFRAFSDLDNDEDEDIRDENENEEDWLKLMSDWGVRTERPKTPQNHVHSTPTPSTSPLGARLISRATTPMRRPITPSSPSNEAFTSSINTGREGTVRWCLQNMPGLMRRASYCSFDDSVGRIVIATHDGKVRVVDMGSIVI